MKSDIGTIISIDKLLSKYKKFIGKKSNHAFIGFLVSKSSCEVRSVWFFQKTILLALVATSKALNAWEW